MVAILLFQDAYHKGSLQPRVAGFSLLFPQLRSCKSVAYALQSEKASLKKSASQNGRVCTTIMKPAWDFQSGYHCFYRCCCHTIPVIPHGAKPTNKCSL